MTTICRLQKILIALCMICIWAPRTIAGEAPVLSLGDRVRVELVDSKSDSCLAQTVTGKLAKLDQSTITLELTDAGPVLELSRQQITGMEVFVEGMEAGEGAAFGASVGLVLASLFGFLPGGRERGTEMSLTPVGRMVLSSLVFVPLGAALGAASAPGEHWEPVPESEIHIGLGRVPTGEQGIFVAVRF